MMNRSPSLQRDFDGVVRAALAFAAVFVVTSCTGERAETTASSSAAVVAEASASSNRIVDSSPTDIDASPTDMGCPDPSSYFIEITGDAGTTTFRSSCASATRDFGAVAAVGGPFLGLTGDVGSEVVMEACSHRSSGAAKIAIVGNKYAVGSVYFRDALGKVFVAFSTASGPGVRIGPLGETIEGTYQATLTTANPDGGPSIDGPYISGSFRVCHLQDVDLRPLKK